MSSAFATTLLRQALPSAEIYYAVQANPAAEIVSTLAALGANFDLASRGELDICLGLNIPPQRLSFGNTIKSLHQAERWVYLDAGLYIGLDETLGERIHYRFARRATAGRSPR